MRLMMLAMIVLSVVAIGSVAAGENTQITDCDGVLISIDGRDRLEIEGKKIKLAKLAVVLNDRIASDPPDCIVIGVDGLTGIRTILDVMEVARVAVAEAALDISVELVPMPQ